MGAGDGNRTRVLSLGSPSGLLHNLRKCGKVQVIPNCNGPVAFAAAPCLSWRVARNGLESACCTLLHGTGASSQPWKLERPTRAALPGRAANRAVAQLLPRGHVALLIGHTSRTIPDLDRRPYDVRDTEGVLAELLSQPEEVTYTGRSWDAVSFISSNRTGLARSAHLNS